MFPVTGTTVMTPRPSRVAVALAASLLTTTAGRLLGAGELGGSQQQDSLVHSRGP